MGIKGNHMKFKRKICLFFLLVFNKFSFASEILDGSNIHMRLEGETIKEQVLIKSHISRKLFFKPVNPWVDLYSEEGYSLSMGRITSIRCMGEYIDFDVYSGNNSATEYISTVKIKCSGMYLLYDKN